MRQQAAAGAALLLVTALVLIYWPVLSWLAVSWRQDEDLAHAPLLPLISAWLIWRSRAQIAQSWHRERPAREAMGVLDGAGLLLAGLILDLVGCVIEIHWRLRAFSLLIVLLGLVRLLAGRGVERLLRFPVLYPAMGIPTFALLADRCTASLQLFSAGGAALCLGVLGIPVERLGVNLHTSRYDFVVAAPCSGLKSVVVLATLAVLLAHLAPGLRRHHRWLLCLLSVPFALAANTLRIVLVVLLAYALGRDAAEGFLHGLSGIFTLAVAAALLGLCAARWRAGQYGRALQQDDESNAAPRPGTASERVPASGDTAWLYRRIPRSRTAGAAGVGPWRLPGGRGHW